MKKVKNNKYINKNNINDYINTIYNHIKKCHKSKDFKTNFIGIIII